MIKEILRWVLAAFMIFAGISHFTDPDSFVRIVPSFLPGALALVYISGVFEILGGVGLLIPRMSRFAAWGLIALYIAVFPANIYMALNEIPFGEGPTPAVYLWLRLPLQFLLIAWAWWYTKSRTKT